MMIIKLGDQRGQSYTHPEFTIEPAFCLVDYTYIVTPLQDGSTAFKKQPESNDRTSEFEYTKDNLPMGPPVQTQTVTVLATSHSKHGIVRPPKTVFGTWTLSFLDACLDD